MRKMSSIPPAEKRAVTPQCGASALPLPYYSPLFLGVLASNLVIHSA